MSIGKEALLRAYEKGYRVVNGEVISPFSGNPLKLMVDTRGYLTFSIKRPGLYKVDNVLVHRLLAYQKYGDDLFKEGIEVRHKDNDKLNNSEENILIGNHEQNMHDIPKVDRKKYAINASSHLRKFTDDQMNQIRSYHHRTKSYKKTMEFFGITSKGTLHHILNNKYQTTV